MRDGVLLWARDVNERGGLDGHPVEVVAVDDGGDPARHFSAVKNLVENENVFAFVGQSTANSDSGAVRAYLQERRVPIVGGDLAGPKETWIPHPMYFPQGPAGFNLLRASAFGAAQMRPDQKRWGSLTCRESPICTELKAGWPDVVRQAGLDPVYNAEISIGQPDFTAECLGAREAEVELLALATDPNSVGRVTQSCARQGYHPTYVLPSAVVSTAQNGDPNLEGAIGLIATVPWMSSASPGAKSFQQAVQRYAPNSTLNQASTVGWSAGKLLEHAVAATGGLGSPPDRERLIKALYTTKDVTLDGVSVPLTFVEGKDKNVPCWFSVEFTDEQWTEGNGGRYSCP